MMKSIPQNLYLMLVVPTMMWLMSSFAQAATWPNPLIIDSSGQVGDVIAEVPISDELLKKYKLFTGAAYLTVKDADTISDDQTDKGVFAIQGSNGAIGIRFVGSLTVSANNETHVVNKGVDTGLESLSGLVEPPYALIQANSPRDATWCNVDIYVSGTIQLFRLKDGPIDASQITLPTVVLTFNSLLLNGLTQADSENILTSEPVTVGSTRNCQIYAAGTNIDFGQIKDNALAGELVRNKVTVLGIRCVGVASSDTVVTMSIESPTEGVGNDVSAIGMKLGDQTSDNLVVKAKLDQNSAPTCQSSGGWLDLTKIHQIGILDKGLAEIAQEGMIYWSLCKKTNAPLPIGTYNAVAYLNITFK